MIYKNEQTEESKTVCSFLDALHTAHARIKQQHQPQNNQIAGSKLQQNSHTRRMRRNQTYLPKRKMTLRRESTRRLLHQLENKVSAYIKNRRR